MIDRPGNSSPAPAVWEAGSIDAVGQTAQPGVRNAARDALRSTW